MNHSSTHRTLESVRIWQRSLLTDSHHHVIMHHYPLRLLSVSPLFPTMTLNSHWKHGVRGILCSWGYCRFMPQWHITSSNTHGPLVPSCLNNHFKTLYFYTVLKYCAEIINLLSSCISKGHSVSLSGSSLETWKTDTGQAWRAHTNIPISQDLLTSWSISC